MFLIKNRIGKFEPFKKICYKENEKQNLISRVLIVRIFAELWIEKELILY